MDFYEEKTCRKSGKGNASTSASGPSATGIPSLQEAAWASLGCFAYAEAILRPAEYGRCTQEIDEGLCPRGVRCNRATGLCMTPDCGSRLPASGGRATASTSGRRQRSRPGAHSASGPASVLAELRKHKSVLRADAVRLDKALKRKPTAARSRSLASVLEHYQKDVDALRASVKRIAENDPSARPAAQAVLTTFGYGSAGLESFAAAISTGRKAKAMRLGRQARQSFKKADASSRKARMALGCGSSC